MGRRKRKNIYIKDPEVQKKIEDLRKLFPGMTYDELFKAHLKVPETDQIIRGEYDKIIDQLDKKYKGGDDFRIFMSLEWNLIINAAHGEYDIKMLIYNIEKEIRVRTYRKK